jgi:hypothetical protein
LAVADAEVTQAEVAETCYLALPDFEQAKATVLNSLSSLGGQRTYDYAIKEFADCSKPRLAVNRTVLVGYGMHHNASWSKSIANHEDERNDQMCMRDHAVIGLC